jgi:hypothetical protein
MLASAEKELAAVGIECVRYDLAFEKRRKLNGNGRYRGSLLIKGAR